MSGWLHVACPLCGSAEHATVLSTRSTFFGTEAQTQLVRCGCGLLLTNPQPRGKTLGAFYATDEYYTHGASPGLKHRLRRTLQRMQLRGPLARLRLAIENHSGIRRYAKRNVPHHFTLPRGGRVLDFGCGNGDVLRLMMDLGLDVVGVEPDTAARNVAIAAGVPVKASLAELDSKPFDRIILRHVLEHLTEPVQTVRDLAARLAPDGLMMIAVPNADAMQAEVFGEHWLGYDMPRHLWHFTPGAMRDLAKLAGLDVISLTTVELESFATISAAKAQKVSGVRPSYRPDPLAIEAANRGTEIVMVAGKSR